MPLLSICIPTYNRSTLLSRTIESIVTDPVFSAGEVELVISDNASTDDTEAVVRAFAGRYGNVIYSKNSENVADRNFPIAISLAGGEFCKLYNDTAQFLPGALSELLECVRANLDKKPVLFFANGNCGQKRGMRRFDTIDAFVCAASYWTTWIGAFGIWKSDFDSLADRFAGTELKLWQTKVLYDTAVGKKTALIFDSPLVEIQIVRSKGGYNIFQIFAGNFLDILGRHQPASLRPQTVRHVKRDLFYRFLVPWYFNVKVKGGLTFDLSDMRSTLRRHYPACFFVWLNLLAVLYGMILVPKKCLSLLTGKK